MLKQKSHILIVMILDLLIIIVSGMAALYFRFEFSFNEITPQFLDSWQKSLPIQIVATLVVFYWQKMYHYVWHFVNFDDVSKMVVVITALEAVLVVIYYATGLYMPKSVAVMTYLFKLILFVGMRCSVRLYSTFATRQREKNKDERILLIGAGDAGNALLREINENPQKFGKVAAIIDDNPVKSGKQLFGATIIGGRERIQSAVDELDITKIIFAIPTASKDDRREILQLAKSTGVEVKVVPGMYQLYSGEVSVKELKDVEIEDLLGRDPVQLDTEEIRRFLEGKTVLVTGGGGSIGSELSRQVAMANPKELIILDIYENNAYDIQQELKRRYANLNLVVEIASVRDAEKIEGIFDKYHPNIVFHAAAHKHVPLMEDCPDEAIKNNIFGTYNVVKAAEKFGVKKFIMISTDKAVNPTNVMGATKRFCEMILQAQKEQSVTEFASVRFGNVLGSNGSVVPLFKKQIAEGGPVTVTDKRINRFFMTIPEAAKLVLEAGAMAKQNQVFVLDMGSPVKIIDLAENLIRLSGLEPYKDIQIVETGLRPGEKLYEELLMKSEHLVETTNKKIFVEEQSEFEDGVIERYLEELHLLIERDHSNEEVKAMLKRMVPTYREAQ